MSDRHKRWTHRWRPLVLLGAPSLPGPLSPVEDDSRALIEDLWLASVAAWADPGWSGVEVRPEVATLVPLPPGPALLAALASLAGGACRAPHEPALPDLPAPGRGQLPCPCQLVVAAAWDAVQGYVQVGSARALTSAAGQEPTKVDGIVDPGREELALALRATPNAAAARLERARDLCRSSELAAAVEEGLLPPSAGASIAGSLANLDPGDAAEVVAATVWRARYRASHRKPWTSTTATAYARRRAMRTPSWTRARARAVAARRVTLQDHGDGTATLACTLASADALRIHRRLTAWARTLLPDNRGIDAIRADLVRDILLGDRQSRSTGVEVQVVISAEALLGLSEESARIPGFGAIPADTARELAADAPWRSWLTDAGTVRSVGTRRYRPTAALARLVRARQPECAFPGCRHDAQRCDLDHITAYPAGTTEADNLQPLCRRHHRLKTHAGWSPGADGWTSPAGVTAAA